MSIERAKNLRANNRRIRLDRRQFLAASILLPLLRKRRVPSLYAKLERPPIYSGIPLGFGLGIPWQNEDFHPGWTDRTLDVFNPPWWFNWKFDAIDQPGNVPMYWHPALDARFDEAVQAANDHPAKMWLLSHEPDRGNGIHPGPGRGSPHRTRVDGFHPSALRRAGHDQQRQWRGLA